MAFAQNGIARLRIGVEPNGSYGLDLTGTIGNLTDVRFMESTPVLGQTVIKDEATVQRFTQRRAQLFGFSKPTFELSSELCGSGQTLNAASTNDAPRAAFVPYLSENRVHEKCFHATQHH